MMAEARIDFEGPTPRLCSRAFAPSDIGLANPTRASIGPDSVGALELGRKAASLGDQSVILGIGLRSVGLERRIRHFSISLFARPDRIDFSFPAPLRDIDTIDASTIEAEHLLLKRRRKLRVPMRFDQRRC